MLCGRRAGREIVQDGPRLLDSRLVVALAEDRSGTRLMDRLGVTATCRASFALYNTKAEVDALITALTKAHDLFA